MILYYAIGGGLGHLTRARAVIHTLGSDDRVAVMSASRQVGDHRITGGFDLISVPRELADDSRSYRRWLDTMLETLSPSAIYFDTFPAGILGEFCGLDLPEGIACYHIARLLRWDLYRKVLHGSPPCFDATYLLEPLAQRHDEFLRDHSVEMKNLPLTDPPTRETEELRRAAQEFSALAGPRWLVVHSGPENEIMELIDYASQMQSIERCEARVALISPVAPTPLPPGIIHLDIYPAASLFPLADRIITGCGFNTMRQTEAFRERHRFIPFPRRYDDQFLRAAQRQSIFDFRV